MIPPPVLLILAIFHSGGPPLHPPADLDSLTHAFARELERLPSPAFDALHRSVHQNGYANVLYDELKQDSMSAFAAFLRMKLHKAFSIPHIALVAVLPNPGQEIHSPIVINFSTAFIVMEWQQTTIYKRAPETLPDDPWETKGEQR
jgi:hypothetical protein